MSTLKEIFRRIYHEMVYARTRVHVSVGKKVLLEHPPIFIIGVFRSGTTLLRYIIDSHSRICCPPESDFINVLERLLTDEYSKRGLKDMGYDEEHVIQKIRELCIYFFGNYAGAKGKLRWADKSPAYVDNLDFIAKLFPEALFVIIYRHPLDQVDSMTKGGTRLINRLVEYQSENEDVRIIGARYWLDKTRRMRKFAENNPKQSIEIRYEDLCETPIPIVRDIFKFIDEPWEPQVMHFYEFEHDKGKEDGRVGATRGFTVSKDNYKKWPAIIIDQCSTISSELMRELKYYINS